MRFVLCVKRATRAGVNLPNLRSFALPARCELCFLWAVLYARNFLKYWLPVLVWMSIIFTASGDSKSSQRSSRIIGPLLHWVFPDLPQETIDAVVFAARKCAHLTVYAVLALLVWRGLRKPVRGDARPWSWRTAGHTMIVVVLYAASDELHQAFVPPRQGKLHDVALDTAGGAAALVALYVFGRWRKWW